MPSSPRPAPTRSATARSGSRRSTPSRASAPGRWAPTRSDPFIAGRRALLERGDLRGAAFCSAYTELVDGWLRERTGDEAGVAVVAVGGYGRSELCPGSDLDVLLLHRNRRDIASFAERLWYPIWDAGIGLDHSVRTPKEVAGVTSRDLKTILGLLDARVVAGDAQLAATPLTQAREEWVAGRGRWLSDLDALTTQRHARFGEVAFLLEPDIKEGKGGLRDAATVRAAALAQPDLVEAEPATSAATLLLAVRVELHRVNGRGSDVLSLQDQDAVADAAGFATADELMAAVADAARTLAWWSDEAWRRLRALESGGRRGGSKAHPVEADLDADDDLADPATVWRVATRAARAGAVAPAALDRLARDAVVPDGRWSPATRAAFVEFLSSGRGIIPVLEGLDQKGLLVRLLPEWAPARSRPQRNAYHRFTVDRHLWEAAANAAALTGRVERPDLLLTGAFFHDLGKAYPGDHTEAGMAVMAVLGPRLGFDAADTAVLVAMIEHHLLLPDVATRRDLDDPATVEAVAAAVGSPLLLDLLGALTEADSLATGPSAWSGWKADLVRDLVDRTRARLTGARAPSGAALPTDAHRRLMARGGVTVERTGDTVTVVAPDRPGLLSRVAGAIALHRLDVRAAAIAGENGMGVEVFTVEPVPGADPDWARLEHDIERAVTGRLALEARLTERARAYASAQRPAAAEPVEPRVEFDNDASAQATVIEVRAADAVGVLYRITRALADCDLDVRSAKVSTLGHEVVDAFYVYDSGGGKVTDREYMAEIERAVLAALTR